MPIFETVFRETVAYKFYVKAPNRKVVGAWAKKNTARLCNNNINRQVVEERGWEELRKVECTPSHDSLDVCLDARGKECGNKNCTLLRKVMAKKKK